MRIGYNLTYLRPGKVGGSEVYARSLLSELCAMVEQPVTVFCPEEAAASFGVSRRLVVVPVLSGAFSQRKRLLAENWRLRSWLRAHPVDVLFSPANFAPALLPVAVPQVASVCDLQHLAFPENFSLGTRVARSVLFRATFQRCREMVAISEFTRSEVISRYRVAPDRITATPLGVDLPPRPDATAVADVRNRYALPEQYVCFPAMVAPHKNHATLFRALAALRHEKGRTLALVLTGASLEAFETLRPLMQSLGVAEQVRILGFVPRQDVHPILAGAAALAYPSRFEGFGLPLLEAMYLDVPVVSSRAASLPEVAGDAALLVAPDDVEGWANALDAVTRDSVLRRRLLEAGRANVRRFSWERCATTTLEVLHRAARPR